jgi:hypothetical protein
MNTGSLRVRMLVAAAISIVAALAISALGLTLLFERHVERRVEAELKTYLEQVLAGLGLDPGGRLAAGATLADPRFGKPLSGLYWQVRSGSEVQRSRSLWDQELRLPDDALADSEIHRHRIAGPDGGELIAIERSVTLAPSLGGGAARAVVAQSASDVAAATRAFAGDLVPYLGLLALLLIGSAYLQVAIGLRPLDAVRAGLADMRAGRTRRLGNAFPDEIRPMAAELDALLEARDQQVTKARARAGDPPTGSRRRCRCSPEISNN